MDFDVESFKTDFKKYGEDDLKSQLVHLRKLAKVYKQRALDCSPSTDKRWLVFVKVGTLITSINHFSHDNDSFNLSTVCSILTTKTPAINVMTT